MTDVTCDREPEVVRAALAGRWPDRCDEALRGHVESCPACGEAVEVAALFGAERSSDRRHVLVPSAGQVWWRAAVRARLDATRAAARPMTLLHGIAGGCAVGLFAAGIGVAWPWIQESLSVVGARVSMLSPSANDIAAITAGVSQRGLFIALGVAACLVLAPLAVYLALGDE